MNLFKSLFLRRQEATHFRNNRSLGLRPRMTVFFLALLFAGCSLQPIVPIKKEVYVQELAQAVCYAYNQLNKSGHLTDTAIFTADFEKYVRKFIVEKQGINEAAWLAAKERYFTPEEHEKLIKLHFAWCLTGFGGKK